MIRRILVPLDGSPVAEQALAPARQMAMAMKAGLLLVRAVGSFDDAEARRPAITSAAEYLRSVQERLADEGVETGAVVLPHEPAQAILFAAELPGADLIVMCAVERSGLGRFWAGSVTETLLRQTTIPVLFMPVTDAPPQRPSELFRKILVPLDGSAHAEAALRYLMQTSLVASAAVTLLQVVEPPPAFRQPLAVEFADAPLSAKAGLETERRRQEAERHLRHLGSTSLRAGAWQVRVTIGDPTAEILQLVRAEGIDLIVLATHRRHGLDRLLRGSVAGEILHHAEAPVLILAGEPPALGTSVAEARAIPEEEAARPVASGWNAPEDTAI